MTFPVKGNAVRPVTVYTVNGVSARVEAVASNQIAVIPDTYIFGLAGTPYKLTVGNEAELKTGGRCI